MQVQDVHSLHVVYIISAFFYWRLVMDSIRALVPFFLKQNNFSCVWFPNKQTSNSENTKIYRFIGSFKGLLIHWLMVWVSWHSSTIQFLTKGFCHLVAPMTHLEEETAGLEKPFLIANFLRSPSCAGVVIGEYSSTYTEVCTEEEHASQFYLNHVT